MGKPKVKICHAVDESAASYQRLGNAGIDVVWESGQWDARIEYKPPEELILDPGTVALATVANRTLRINGVTFDSAPELRLAAYYSNGYDNIDLNAATKRGVLVMHSPTESNWGGVAEGTFTLILAMLKKVRQRDQTVKNGGWRAPSLFGTYIGSRLSDGYKGITIGIIGLGRIGSRLADLFGPWRVSLLGFDPHVEEAKFTHHNVQQVDLDTLLRNSDVITIHCDLNDETRNIISEDAINKMKPNTIIVNTARGPCVDLDALIGALQQGRISGAALDAMPQEPPEHQSPLLGLEDKVLLSPHMVAANNGGGLIPAIPWVEKAILSALKGQVPEYVVNKEVLPLWNKRFKGKPLIFG